MKSLMNDFNLYAPMLLAWQLKLVLKRNDYTYVNNDELEQHSSTKFGGREVFFYMGWIHNYLRNGLLTHLIKQMSIKSEDTITLWSWMFR